MDGMPYFYYVPENAKDGNEHPLILWLHGFGEGGYEGSESTTSTLRANRAPVCFTQEDAQEVFDGAFIVAPQAPTSWIQRLNSKGYDETLLKILDQMTEDYSVDTNRIYIAGASSGGYGVVWMVAKHAERFAAALPICPGIAQTNIDAWRADMPIDEDLMKLTSLPTGTIQVANDDAVPVDEGSRRIAKVCGDQVIYTEFEQLIMIM